MIPRKRAPSHPGEVLKELFLDPAGVTQAKFAAHMGWTTTRVNQLLRGKRAVTPETALALSDALGTSPDVWIHLQVDYDLWQARQAPRRVVKPMRLAS